MRQLPDQKEDDQEWTVKLLRDTSHRYITNRENAERHCATKDDNKHTVRSLWPTAQDVGEGKATTDTLVSVTKSPEDQKFRKRAIGIYCKRKRCSDECTNFLTVKARKEKIKRLCFICLKPGHHQRDCKTNRACVHGQRQSRHHKSFGINKCP